MITGHKVEPCPRCRAGQAFLHLHKEAPCLVRCGKCGAMGPVRQNADEAVAGWNRESEGRKPCQK